MNAPATPAAVAAQGVRPDDYQVEARELTEWLFQQAAFYRKHAPACSGDIQKFEAAAALIDSFRAGLVLVPPHPAMQAELIRWVSVAEALPDADETVLVWQTNGEEPWPGYLDGDAWRSADGFWIGKGLVTHWASMPAGPATVPPIEARHEAEEPAQ